MTKPTDDAEKEQKMIEALNETWSKMDSTFTAVPAPLPDWTAMVKEHRRLAKRKMWKELAILWSIAVPLFGVMFLLITGQQTVFWMLQGAATAAIIPWLITEFKRAVNSGEGEIAP